MNHRKIVKYMSKHISYFLGDTTMTTWNGYNNAQILFYKIWGCMGERFLIILKLLSRCRLLFLRSKKTYLSCLLQYNSLKYAPSV